MFYHMRDLRRRRRHLDLDRAKLLATALVFSRLNYCNSRFYGVADIDLIRLQTCSEPTDPPGDKVCFIYSQPSTASFSCVWYKRCSSRHHQGDSVSIELSIDSNSELTILPWISPRTEIHIQPRTGHFTLRWHVSSGNSHIETPSVSWWVITSK